MLRHNTHHTVTRTDAPHTAETPRSGWDGYVRDTRHLLRARRLPMTVTEDVSRKEPASEV